MIAPRAANNYYYALAEFFSLRLFGVSLLPAEYDRICISLIPLSFLSIKGMSRLCSMRIDSCDPAFAIWMPRPVEGDTTWNNIEHHCCIWPSKRSIFVCNQLLDAMMLSHRVHINTFEDLQMRGPMAIESCADVCGHRHGVHSLLHACPFIQSVGCPSQPVNIIVCSSGTMGLPSSLGKAFQVMNLPESCWKLSFAWGGWSHSQLLGVIQCAALGQDPLVCWPKPWSKKKSDPALAPWILEWKPGVHANGFPPFLLNLFDLIVDLQEIQPQPRPPVCRVGSWSFRRGRNLWGAEPAPRNCEQLGKHFCWKVTLWTKQFVLRDLPQIRMFQCTMKDASGGNLDSFSNARDTLDFIQNYLIRCMLQVMKQ